MTTIILLVLLLVLVQALLLGVSKFRHNTVEALAGPQDKIALGTTGERVQRALRNLHETLPVFLGLALLSLIHQVEAGAMLGAVIYLVSRIIYVPLYVLGVPVMRTVVWYGGTLGLVLMVPPLLGH